MFYQQSEAVWRSLAAQTAGYLFQQLHQSASFPLLQDVCVLLQRQHPAQGAHGEGQGSPPGSVTAAGS